MTDEILTVQEAAELLKISRDTVYRLMKKTDPKKRIAYIMVGDARRIKSSEIERYLKDNEV